MYYVWTFTFCLRWSHIFVCVYAVFTWSVGGCWSALSLGQTGLAPGKITTSNYTCVYTGEIDAHKPLVASFQSSKRAEWREIRDVCLGGLVEHINTPLRRPLSPTEHADLCPTWDLSVFVCIEQSQTITYSALWISYFQSSSVLWRNTDLTVRRWQDDLWSSSAQ